MSHFALVPPSKTMAIKIIRPRTPFMDSIRAIRTPVTGQGNTLHYVVFCGMHNIATFLNVDHSQDVNTRGLDREETPLHVSSHLGHVWRLLGFFSNTARIQKRWITVITAHSSGSLMRTCGTCSGPSGTWRRCECAGLERCTPLYWASDWGTPVAVHVLLHRYDSPV
jgi:hypothetical protein